MKSLKKYASMLVVILAVVAVTVFLAAPVVALTGKISGEVTNYSGWQAIFGYTSVTTILGIESKTELLKVSPLLITGCLLIIVGLVAAVLTVGKKPSKLITLIGALVLIGGTVLMFLSPQLIMFVAERGAVEAFWNINLGIAAIIAGILSAIASFLMLLKLL